ncbi:MAG TPA: alpha/beta hydrolase, partial [Acidimicrobiales bacterium]|nr:alpha/beta hydrolase [Acidimicrobiales bacterium]
HGQGPRPAGLLNLNSLVEGAVASLPAHLTVLAGHSLGAIVTLGVALRHPGLADALVLEEPPGTAGVDTDFIANGIAAEAKAVRVDRASYWQRIRNDNPKWDDADVERAVASMEAVDVPAVVGGLQGDLSWDLPELLGQVDIPVLVIAAPPARGQFPLTGNTALRGRDREAVRRLVPEDGFVVLEGGHSLHRDEPERVAQLIVGLALSATSQP